MDDFKGGNPKENCPQRFVPPWFEPRLPEPFECSPGLRLIELAGEDPQAPLLVHGNGHCESRAQVLQSANALAGKLRGLGAAAGDRLLVWLPTGPDMVRTIFACSLLGMTLVPLNTAMRGEMLERMIAIGKAELMVCHPTLLDRLDSISLADVTRVILPGGAQGSLPRCAVSSEVSSPKAAFEPMANRPWDMAAIIFSSGTTGPAKGVRVPAAQLWTLANVFYGHMTATDRILLMYPLFHIAGLSAFYAALAKGASMAVTEAFSATHFWDLLRRTGSTTVPGLGPTFISVLGKAAPAQSDRDNPLRIVNVQTTSPAAKAFANRFGCSIVACYGMTEASGICVSNVDEAVENILGRPRSGLEVRVVDGNDIEVPPGAPGELIYRSQLPWTVNDGYEGDEAATRRAWRNGWFHTGDIVRQDGDGNIRFVDRTKDVIRRRSENISSSEVETVLRRFPAVLDAAVIGVDHNGDQEILALLTELPERQIDLVSLTEFLAANMPHFMVPRFFRILTELPKTHTDRVEKEDLRSEGITLDSWDREAAGLLLRGQRLG
jgi:crotonobetaine/carnitine-CoA ligase